MRQVSFDFENGAKKGNFVKQNYKCVKCGQCFSVIVEKGSDWGRNHRCTQCGSYKTVREGFETVR